jgi:arylsulfatase A
MTSLRKTLLSLFLLSTVCLPLLAAPGGKPNIFLIVTDDQGWWDLGVHGNPVLETPTLNRLAAEGVRFTHFYASPVCTPTRASLMTGRHYQRTGAFDTYMGRDTLSAEEVILPQLLQKQGYRTSLVGKWHLGRYRKYHPLERGFQDFFGFWQYGFINRYFDSEELFDDQQPVATRGYITDVLTDQAIRRIEQHRQDRFFLYLAYNAPHSPFQAPDSLVEKYLEKRLPLREAQIYAMLDSLDQNIHRLLQSLEANGLRENTLVIFMSDNGGVSRYFKAGLRAGKGTVYEGGVRVPFIARWPGRFPAGAVVDAMAQHVDLLPTLCEISGASPPAGRIIDGRSLLPLLLAGKGSSPHEVVYHQWNRVRPLVVLPDAAAGWSGASDGAPVVSWAIRDANGRKLVATTDRSKPAAQDRFELFDLAKDPGESHDLAASHPEEVKALKIRFEKWFGEVTTGQSFTRVPIEVGKPDENPVEIDILWGEPHGKKVSPTYFNYNRDTIENWSEPQDFVAWKIDVITPGKFEVILSYGCDPADAGSRLSVQADSSSVSHRTEATASRTAFRPLSIGVLSLKAGPQTLSIQPVTIVGKELFALHKVWLKHLTDK